MINLGRWRWPVVVVLPVGVLAGLFQFNAVRLNYESVSVLAYKGETKRVIGQGNTPARALHSTQDAAAALAKSSLDQKKKAVQSKIAVLKVRQKTRLAALTSLDQQRQSVSKGKRQAWTPAMATRLSQAQQRHRVLVTNFPTHTDIPVLAQEIKSLQTIQSGQTHVDRASVAKLAKQITEARTELSLLSIKVRSLEQAEKALKSDWTLVQAPAAPRWPVGVPGWPVAAGSVFAVVLLGVWLTSSRRQEEFEAPVTSGLFTPAVKAEKISLELATEESAALPDDPISRKAAALYQRWLDLVKIVYAPGLEAPKDIFTNAEPLFKETVAYLGEGHDPMTRHLARVVVPGDLFSHVARTVLMALMGACEAGASGAQQQGMTFAALFHDLAVAPRPAPAWEAVGSEVGRLSSGLLRKIPGIPAALLKMIEDILVSMDEYTADTWQNVARVPEVAPFAKLLNQIDRFDKVLQKQKTRLTRRIAAN